MANLVATAQTSLGSEDVIVRAVQFFANDKWTPQTQSARVVTFVGTPKISAAIIILYVALILGGGALTATMIGAVIGVPMLIVGLVLGIRSGLRMRGISGRQNLIVAASPAKTGTDVDITYPKRAKDAVDRFVGLLPAVSA